MPGVPADSRSRLRARLNEILVSLACHICPAPAGGSCDYNHEDRELLVQLDKGPPPLYAHVPRIARAIARRPRIRRLVLAQFDEGQVPAGLTGGKT